MAPSLRELLASTPLSGGNAPYVEALYEQFLADPQSVDAASGANTSSKLRARQRGASRSTPPCRRASSSAPRKPRMAARPSQPGTDAAAKQGAVSRLVQIYANRGHLIAKLDPLGLQKRRAAARAGARLLRPDRSRPRHRVPHRLAPARSSRRALKLREILAQLEHVYCGTIGAEFAHVSNTEERLWLQDQFLVGRLQRQAHRPRSRRTSSGSSRPPKASSATCTPSTSARSASRSKAAIR